MRHSLQEWLGKDVYALNFYSNRMLVEILLMFVYITDAVDALVAPSPTSDTVIYIMDYG